MNKIPFIGLPQNVNKTITIFTDGGARGNPGPATIGIVINSRFTENGIEKAETTNQGKFLGSTTNNVAEYSALIEALELIKMESDAEIVCNLDSELVVKQLNGQYRVKDENLKQLWQKVKLLQAKFKNISFKHIPRAQNKLADKIVNEVLDSISLP